jgi:hypothetical protein
LGIHFQKEGLQEEIYQGGHKIYGVEIELNMVAHKWQRLFIN